LLIALAANPEEIGVALDHFEGAGLDAVHLAARPSGIITLFSIRS
jgi:hypothetical protein